MDKIFGPIVDAKMHGTDTVMKEVAGVDLNIRLVPEIMAHLNWRQLITELMFAKMRAGQLKVRNSHTWIADFGNAIENQKLKEAYIVASLSYSVSMGDMVSIQREIKAALPLVKKPANIAKIKGLKPKIDMAMNLYKTALPGTDMSQFTFQNANGEQVSIKDFKGKLVFVDIWNTGCKPCIAEIPYLKHLEHEMQGKDIVFLSVSCDYDLASWKRFLQKRNMTGQQLIMIGKKDTFFNKIGGGGIPRFVILDKEGKMLDYNCKRPSNPVLNIYLTELLNQPQS
uniref:TlpA family protein disulfide reductase n=1 Tax=Pedobacter schmidteae TaxID=2201271 RepID=UPI0013CF1627|nr:TlpA disulfide reductase family protein [Pedobacter schmidteae]